ncbi:MAG: YggS family pyridoxal phosphate-dependent enzyme [Cytophagales bacterium]|jgi:PLP dependent protein|nr:YggS family pyridoxal phosphate-dependent enzyme [Cytophagales bacterium]MCA6386755.1 YggS family pyridoxal phosphate-dependent enzyme [Cytophagales bacterium]MCA6391622.1 YggS family pyridoxal phosphate-dependent enzyme [Cytophagales bacterium]MCA6396785.1 YggS family pyridoxal phosphate-dependent enzyme [Cytophagales bacterium]MCA6399229.1 YggS family pyridoxal phosphate-dependent enzyme [Cytophagales bacterium]
MDIKSNIKAINETLTAGCKLIAVSKTQPIEKILQAYQTGQRVFGENKAQEMLAKYEALPKDIEWHMIGHLQSNKVKYIAPFVSLIHSVDSVRLLEEINKQGQKINRIIPCLLQMYIANEDTKFGFSQEEVIELLDNYPLSFHNVRVVGLMGMASFTNNQQQIRAEFRSLKVFFEKIRGKTLPPQVEMKELSIGMSGDYRIGMDEGSTLVRIGTSIFGERNYNI